MSTLILLFIYVRKIFMRSVQTGYRYDYIMIYELCAYVAMYVIIKHQNIIKSMAIGHT